jgi:transcriptional regulator with XRE-family HTH domain
MLTARDKDVGERLAEMRKHRKLTQQKLAVRACISLAMLRKYEQGRAAYTSDVLSRLAAVLLCRPSQLTATPGSPLPRRCKADWLEPLSETISKLDCFRAQHRSAERRLT